MELIGVPKEQPKTREEKGQDLFDAGKVCGNVFEGFKVEGSSGIYAVAFQDKHGDVITCNCVDFKIHWETCKHGFAAWLLFQKQLAEGFYC